MTAPNNMSYTIIIPARLNSTRFPNKVLATYQGVTLLQYTHQRAQQSNAKRIIVAVDDAEVYKLAQQFSHDVVMTSTAHESGTDRLSEVVSKLGLNNDEIIVNLQADEPLMPVSVLNRLGTEMCSGFTRVMTVATPISDNAEELNDPNVVKVVTSSNDTAMYFSRSVIPFCRDSNIQSNRPNNVYLRHLGIYAYRAGFLKEYASWSRPEIEALECLEQLRILWHGEDISVLRTSENIPAGIDTAQDWQHAQPHLIV
jgi:3-deoxy-manno-octulosonate cytidylyltransferase (CMP-KDO synthetase)